MRSMSLEKSRQREAELAQEIERLQMEIKTLQKNSEEAANVNQQLSKEVKKIDNFFFHDQPIFVWKKLEIPLDGVYSIKWKISSKLREFSNFFMKFEFFGKIRQIDVYKIHDLQKLSKNVYKVDSPSKVRKTEVNNNPKCSPFPSRTANERTALSETYPH